MLFEFKFPDIGEGIHEGKILQLKCKPQDVVREGDILAVVETDKVVAEIPSPWDGALVRYGAEEGQVIRVGETLAYIEAEKRKAVTKPEEAVSVVGKLDKGKETVLPASGEGIIDNSADDITLLDKKDGTLSTVASATPVARKLAADSGVDIAKIRGSGPGGRVIKQDVLKVTERKPPVVEETFAAGTVQKLTTIRKTIAVNMEKSQKIPAAVVHESVVVDDLVALRKDLNEGTVNVDVPHLTYLPFFIKVTAASLGGFRRFNATFHPERDEIELHDRINIGFAVDTDEGLVVPVVRDADRLSVVEIQEEIARLTEAAKNRNITLAQLRGGTFTVSGYGSFGGTYGRPMIFPPQVAILGTGRIHQQPAVIDGAVVPGYVLPLSLVFDHRVIDGGYAARFLNQFMAFISRPSTLLVSLK
jgi:pyruvate dehydrogenase E2 component (dihydrolipoamide acetyltransferase)